jgi:hypothetical protein
VVIGQIDKECIAREPTLEKIFSSGQKNGNLLQGLTVKYIDRNKNSKDDKLTKASARNNPLPANVFLQTIIDTSIKTIEPEPRVINIIQGED